LLTAKHNFFTEEENSSYKENYFSTYNVKIEILQDDKSFGNIDVFQEKVFFFENCESNELLDIALIIINSNLENIPSTSVYDTTNENYNKHIFYTAGYPSYIKETDTKNTLQFYNVNPRSNYKNDIERVINTDGSINFYDYEFPEKLKGMSGSGVFLVGKNGEIALRSIIYKAIPTNQFECVKIDEILDQLNTILSSFELNNIKTNIKPLSINDEVFNLEELADIQNIRDRITQTSKLNTNDISTADHIREKAKELNKEYNSVKKEIEDLSYQYAHLALLAHDKEMQLAKNRFFKRAIDLNPNHITAFSLEKSEYQKNKTTKEISEITPNDANGIYKKYNQLIDLEKDYRNKVRLLKEAINSLSYFENTSESGLLIDTLAIQLNNFYDQEKTTKVVFKYQELADFYHGIPQKYSLALYYNQLSLEIINLFTNPSLYNNISSKIVEKIKSLEKIEYPLSSDKRIEVKNKAKTLFSEEEDKGIKEILDKISYEIFTLKSKEHEQKEITKEIIESLISLHIQNQNIANYTRDNKLDIDTSNHNNNEIKESTSTIKELISKIPEKYNIQIDENTRSELRSIIEEPASAISSTLNKIDVITDKASTYVENAENSFNTLVKHGKDDLLIINSSIQENLSSLSEQKIKLENDKNEVLAFLKSSEKRLLAHIQKLELNTKRKNDAIAFIQNKIYGLQKLVSKALLVQSDNHSDIIELSNKSTQELKQITLACQQLEKQLQESLDYTSDIESIKRAQTRVEHTLVTKTSEALFTHAQYHDDIIAIKHNQNRFEESLLNQTNHALKNYERIVDYNIRNPPLSFGKKVLLALYFIIMISSATYFIVNYGLLDLLEHLWQTA
jgi:uncharacterized protein YlxP (DUF503 family)